MFIWFIITCFLSIIPGWSWGKDSRLSPRRPGFNFFVEKDLKITQFGVTACYSWPNRKLEKYQHMNSHTLANFDLGHPVTMLQKLSNCEVKAWLCWSMIILQSLRFYVKSNFGEFKQRKNVIFGNFIGSEFWF